jgi:hypothetical protein
MLIYLQFLLYHFTSSQSRIYMHAWHVYIGLISVPVQQLDRPICTLLSTYTFIYFNFHLKYPTFDTDILKKKPFTHRYILTTYSALPETESSPRAGSFGESQIYSSR